MTSIRDLARAKLAQLDGGRQAGRPAGQQVSHSVPPEPNQWDSANPQKTAEYEQVSRCPIPIGTGQRDSTSKTGTAGGTVSGTAGTIADRVAAAKLREWHARLSALDEYRAPAGFSVSEWGQLVDDACWLYENHASYAVRQGWGADGLFGVRFGLPYSGGLAQFLRSSRSVLWDGPFAHVTLWGVSSKLNRACGQGLPVLWELN